MNKEIVLSSKLYFSYGQFMVYDRNVEFPGCDWKDGHTAQGFARRESVVAFNTLFNYGDADIDAICGDYQPRAEYERVIAVPFRVISGKVIVNGPDEAEVERSFALPPGHYKLVAAQYATGKEEETEEAVEVINLFFEPLTKPLERSAILVADRELRPSMQLIETAGVAGE